MSNKLLLSLFVVLAGVVAGFGQSAMDEFNPNANGTIHVVTVQPDGKILIGGEFTLLGPFGGTPVTRNHIARLNTDGTIDTNFNPNANSPIDAIVLQPDGKILVSGSFNGVNSIGGQTRNRLARLDPTNGLADSWDPDANARVKTLALDSGGNVLAGGDFTTIGGKPHKYIARLDLKTGGADSFNPNPGDTTTSSGVDSLLIQGDGKIVVGGEFFGIGGAARTNIARLDPKTGLADSFNPNPTPKGAVNALALQADGKIIAGGDFRVIGGAVRTNMARLDPATGLADSFDPSANGSVAAIALQPDGKIIAGGFFSSIGGQTRTNLARLDPATGLADSFNPNLHNSGVDSLAVQPDGKVVAVGSFTTLSPNGTTIFRNRIARFEIDGRLDQTLNLTIIGSYVYAMAVQPDGKMLIGGTFNSVLGVVRSNIARLNTDGTLDTLFNPNANGDVSSIVVQPDGKILAGGAFTSIGGQARSCLARLDATTGAADSFNPNSNGQILAMALQADGKILAAGAFTTNGAQRRFFLARLDPVTGLADSFNPNASNMVFSIAVQPDGRILASGDFAGIGGQVRHHIARLDPVTGLPDSFDPNANDEVDVVALQPDGQVVAGGLFSGFSSIGGQLRNNLARLNGSTGAADLFEPNPTGGSGLNIFCLGLQADGKVFPVGTYTGISGVFRNYVSRLDGGTAVADSFNLHPIDVVFSVTLQADGKILVGGVFDHTSGTPTIGGQTRDYFARVSNDTAALQNLTVTNNTITWTRGGSSPALTRTTFESSTNNVNYTLLGPGTTNGSGWTLTGVNLPTQQNLYIRARGYYRGGVYNGSESITESVRNVFLPPPPPPLLNIRLTVKTNIVLSWPTNFTGYTLESNTNLYTNTWNVVATTPVITGTNNVVTNAVNSPARFYRLHN